MSATPEQAFMLTQAGQISYSILTDKQNEQLRGAILRGVVVEIRRIDNMQRWMFRLHFRAAYVAGQEWVTPRRFVELWPTISHIKVD